MAVTVTATGEVVVLDETDGLQNSTETPNPAGDADDNDILVASLPLAFSSRLITTYGLTLDEAALSGFSGGADTGDNIINITGATASTDLALTGSGGAAFPDYESGATSTFSSGLSAVGDDGTITEIFLFTDPTNNNIVYGVAGDSGGDPIAFAVYLDEVKTSGITTGAKMWTVLVDGFTLAHNTDGSTVAAHDDFLDLTNKLFVAAVSEESFNFAGAPAGQNLFMRFGDVDLSIVVTGRDPANQSEGELLSTGDTVNTSGQTATSLGTNGQQVKAGAGMSFTYVTGSGSTPPDDNIVPNLDQNEADIEANIDFTDVVDATGGAFTISQVNPGNVNTRVSIRITAFTTDAESGVNFVDGIGDADDDPVTITSVTINGESASFTVSGDGVVVSGVKSGDEVGFTTDGVHQRVLIENAQPTKGSGSNISFDLGGFTISQVSSDVEEVGSKVQFEDDGPAISPAILDGQVAFTAGASDGDTGFLDYGEDGPASAGPFVITSFEAMPDNTPLGTITETLSAGDTVLTYSSATHGDLFRLTLDPTAPGGYTFTVLRDVPSVINVLDFGSVDPGGPVEDITITAPGGNDVTFDGFLASDFDGSPTSLRTQFGTGDLNADPIEDVNVSEQGIGLKDNQMDPNVNAAGDDEALKMSFSQDVDGVQVVFDGATGGGSTFDATFEAYDDGVLVDTFTFEDLAAPKGNATRTVTFVPDPAADFDELYIGLNLADKSGVRIHEVATIERPDIPDFALDYTVQATDGDGDTASDTFTVQIDSDLNGIFDFV